MYKHLYSRFLAANPGILHFAAHSHYFWPDVTREAQLEYWDDSSRMVDGKWTFILDDVIPKAQSWIASRLQTDQPRQLVFAPNTHELVCRLLSCFSDRQPVRVVTTDSEFYSFDRQIRRMEEGGLAHVTRVTTEPFATFEERFIQSVGSVSCDLVFTSSIFFNSGLGFLNLDRLVEATRRKNCELVVDGYHAFGAVPVDLSSYRDDMFYLGGGYKYLQSGEGVCFMHVPQKSQLIPFNTGWFAEFAELSARNSGVVGFSEDAWRFAGATFDPSGLYRFNAVMEMLEENGLSPTRVHEFIQGLQTTFFVEMENACHPYITADNLVDCPSMLRGHFLTFDVGDPSIARDLQQQLSDREVVCDVRNSRVRFGFGLYQDENDILEFFKRLR